MNASDHITKHINDLKTAALKELVRAAVALNGGKAKSTPRSAPAKKR